MYQTHHLNKGPIGTIIDVNYSETIADHTNTIVNDIRTPIVKTCELSALGIQRRKRDTIKRKEIRKQSGKGNPNITNRKEERKKRPTKTREDKLYNQHYIKTNYNTEGSNGKDTYDYVPRLARRYIGDEQDSNSNDEYERLNFLQCTQLQTRIVNIYWAQPTMKPSFSLMNKPSHSTGVYEEDSESNHDGKKTQHKTMLQLCRNDMHKVLL